MGDRYRLWFLVRLNRKVAQLVITMVKGTVG